ncbi:MAG: FG-GAP-like repeat-containing protein, partial [Psychrosphaera sp.]|nr:FG-GAP-like repeat-containing protein [Psychrosphaera sp.]
FTDFEVTKEYNGVWGAAKMISGKTALFESSQYAGRYRYRVGACNSSGVCSNYQTSAAFTLSNFNKSASIDDAAVLTGLSGNVGLTSGQFRVNESGAATYAIPLSLPEGVAGVKPQVSLNYSSQGGDGNMGRGWLLVAGGSISRCPMNIFYHEEIEAVQYDTSDKFCLDGQPLVLNDASAIYGEAGTTYHTPIDNFALITAHGTATDSGPAYFTVQTKSGDTYFYGETADAFVEPNKPGGNNDLAKLWALNKVVDVAGNAIEYHYSEDIEKGTFTLASIDYGKNEGVSASRHFARVAFNYIDNLKPQGGYSGGNRVMMDKLLDNVVVTVDGDNYRYYDLNYDTSEVIEERNYLSSVTECVSPGNSCLAPLSFTWQRPALAAGNMVDVTECDTVIKDVEKCVTFQQPATADFEPFADASLFTDQSSGRDFAQMFDINGDGYSDIIYENEGWQALYGPDFANEPDLLSGIGSSDEDRIYALTIDYDGDGKQELLVANGNGDAASGNWHVLTYNPTVTEVVLPRGLTRYINKNFEPVDLGQPSIGFEGAAQVMDVDGDGLQDIVFNHLGKIQMYRNEGGSFSAARDLNTSSNYGDLLFDYNHAVHSPAMQNAAAIDVNGDGRSDLLTKMKATRGFCVDDNWQELTQITTFEDCKTIDGRWTLSTNTYWRMIISDGTLATPRLTSMNIIGYQVDD